MNHLSFGLGHADCNAHIIVLQGRDEVVLGENGLPKADGPLAVEDAVLWFVGKRLDGCATVGSCIGRHENTVAIVKLMVAHEGRPVKDKVSFKVIRSQYSARIFESFRDVPMMIRAAIDTLQRDLKSFDGSYPWCSI